MQPVNFARQKLDKLGKLDKLMFFWRKAIKDLHVWSDFAESLTRCQALAACQIRGPRSHAASHCTAWVFSKSCHSCYTNSSWTKRSQPACADVFYFVGVQTRNPVSFYMVQTIVFLDKVSMAVQLKPYPKSGFQLRLAQHSLLRPGLNSSMIFSLKCTMMILHEFTICYRMLQVFYVVFSLRRLFSLAEASLKSV